MIKKAARNIGINIVRGLVPFRILKRLRPKKFTGRGGQAKSLVDKAQIYKNVYDDMVAQLSTNDIDLRSHPSIAEIGPGDNRLVAYLLSDRADKITLFDVEDKFNAEQNDELLSVLKKEFGFDAIPEKVRYEPAENLEKKQEVYDFVYSKNVLEHVKPLDRYFQSEFNALKKGGISYHSIDLTSHNMHFNNPLDFVGTSDLLWFAMTCNRLCVNRHRWIDIKRIIQETGYKLLSCDFTEAKYSESDIRDVMQLKRVKNHKYTADDLAFKACNIVLQKPS